MVVGGAATVAEAASTAENAIATTADATAMAAEVMVVAAVATAFQVVDAWSEVVNADRSGSVLRYTFASDFASSIIKFMDDLRSDDEIFDFFSCFFEHVNPLIKLEDVQLFSVPICWDYHWFMLCININRGCIDYLNSGRRSVLDEIEVFHRHLARVQSFMLRHKAGRDIDFEPYAFQSHLCPKQTNDDDCGVYTLKFMEHWWGKFSVAIFPSEVKHYRVQIASRLILHPLNDIQLPVVHAATTGANTLLLTTHEACSLAKNAALLGYAFSSSHDPGN